MQSTVKTASLFGAILVSIAAQFPSQAMAATDLGTVGGFTAITQNVGAGSFENFYNFTVAKSGDIVYGLVAVIFQSDGPSISTANIFQGTFSDPLQVQGLQIVNEPTSSSFALNGDFIIRTTSGNAIALSKSVGYTLVVSGYSDGASAYTGAISLSPVPEPENFAMLSAGLGVMGFMVRRRKQKQLTHSNA